MQRKILFFIPLAIILSLCLLLLAGLNQDPKKIASALIDKPVPEFYQANLLDPDQTLSLKDFPKRPFLLNIWGSWCGYCQDEHPFLMEISKDIPILGVDYRDQPQSGIEMLRHMGNPYFLVVNDSRGEFAMKLGVDGAPETYLIDANGVIRYRHSGVLDKATWQKDFLPKINQLMSTD